MAKPASIFYQTYMEDMPALLNQHLSDKNYLLIYPFSAGEEYFTEKRSLNNHRDFAEIGSVISQILK